MSSKHVFCLFVFFSSSRGGIDGDSLTFWGRSVWGRRRRRKPPGPSWQTDNQAGGCLNPTHMGHLTVINSCGIKPLQPEPVKLINSLVFPTRQERERETETGMRDEVWNNTQGNMQINLLTSIKETQGAARLFAALSVCFPSLTNKGSLLKKEGDGA